MIIGLAGGTGSGKSMIVQSLVARVGGRVIDLDSYYCDRSALSREERSRINYDEPTAIDVALLVGQLAELGRGEAVRKPVYSFETHGRTGVEVVAPARLLLGTTIAPAARIVARRVTEGAGTTVSVRLPIGGGA